MKIRAGALFAAGALTAAIVMAASSSIAVAPDNHRVVGEQRSCTTDSMGGCTLPHAFGEQPTAIAVQESGSTGFEKGVINPVNTSPSQFRITFWRTATERVAAGTNLSFSVIYTWGPPDTMPPDTSITSGPTGTVNSTDASFGFSSTEAGTFECKLDAGTFAPCTTPKTYGGLTDGAHTFEVRAIDAVGNVDPTPASRAWTIDATAPDTTITVASPASTEQTGASFEFTATETGTFECKLDAGTFVACTTPKTYSGLSVGSHTFSVRAIDAVSNIDASPATHTWTITAPPPPPGAKPKMGGTVSGNSDWPAWEAAMGASASRRTYNSAITSTFEASNAGSANDFEAGRESYSSFKPTLTATGMSTADQNTLRAHLQSVPVGHPFVLIIWHEPEDNIAAGTLCSSCADTAQRLAAWKLAQQQAGTIVDEVNVEKGVNSKLRLGISLMGPWTFDSRSAYDTWDWDLTDEPALLSVIDVVGIDPYFWNPGDAQMQQMLTQNDTGTAPGSDRATMTKLNGWGKPVVFTEWGTTRIGRSDSQRATDITNAYNWAKTLNADGNSATVPIETMIYFHLDPGTDGRDFWKVIGFPLAEAALRDVMTDSRN